MGRLTQDGAWFNVSPNMNMKRFAGILPVASFAGVMSLSSTLSGQDAPEPIHIISEVHCDPMWYPKVALQETLYNEWVVALGGALDEAEVHGARISYLSTGQFMEWVAARPETGYPLIERLYAHGGQIGTHMHNKIQIGPFNWIQANATTQEQIEGMWDDHIGWVDTIVTNVLGITDLAEIRGVNSILGTHVPSDDQLRMTLLEDYGFVGHEQGPEEQFFVYFEHYVMNPFRPSGDNILKNDPDGPVVIVPFGPVLGVDGIHFGIEQDMRLPAFKGRFLMELLNWLHEVHGSGTDRLWVTGWGAHCHDLVAGTDTRIAWEPMIAWLEQHFVGHMVGGHEAATFSTIPEARDAFTDWEAANPGQANFNYESTATDWNEYPYLVAAARYLALSQLLADLPAVGPARLHQLASSDEPDAFEIHVAYTVHGNPIIIDLAAQLGADDVAVVDPNLGTWEVVTTSAIPLYSQGVIIVAPEDALAITMFGDLNGDGRIDGADLAFMLGNWGGGGTSDLNGDGVVTGADLAILLGNWTT